MTLGLVTSLVWVVLQRPPMIIPGLPLRQHIHQIACDSPQHMHDFGKAEMLSLLPHASRASIQVQMKLLLDASCNETELYGYVRNVGPHNLIVFKMAHVVGISRNKHDKPDLYILVFGPFGPGA